MGRQEFGSECKLSPGEQSADDFHGGPFSQGLIAAQIALDMARERTMKLGLSQFDDFEGLAKEDRETFSLLLAGLIYGGEIPYEEVEWVRSMATPNRQRLIDEAVEWRVTFYGLEEID